MHRYSYKTVYTGIFAVLLALCSWISIPSPIPFTLQTFGIFLTLFLLGGQQGTFAILIYLLLGGLGIPVFSNFGAGFGYLFGSTGGYLIGFLLIGLTCRLFEKIAGKKPLFCMLSLFLGLILCYFFGTLWFIHISMSSGSGCEILTALTMCVFPFVIPDLLKLGLAYVICKRLRPLFPTDIL